VNTSVQAGKVTPWASFQAWVRLLRPNHWIKNSFVLAGVFFAGEWMKPQALAHAMLALWSFALASSATYALNDALDAAADRRHPRKCRRPVAAGLISPSLAMLVGLGLAIISLGLAAAQGWILAALIAAYLVINGLYSRWLKHEVLLDVFAVASGFVLRLLAGTLGIGIAPSQWFLLCTFLLSLFLGFSKRYAERIDQGQEQGDKRDVIGAYTPDFLRALLSITLSATLTAYGLYTMSPRTQEIHGTSALIYTLPLAAFTLFRYLFLVLVKGYGEDTAAEVLRDRTLFWSVVLYVFFTGLILLR
jgi:4-hydroxybenzoate polyprenyltransferase